jgi:hypothetical protein
MKRILPAIILAAVSCSRARIGHEDAPAIAPTQPQPQETTQSAASTEPTQAVVGLVRDRAQASALIGQLQRGGFSNERIAALLFDRASTHEFAQKENTGAPAVPAEESDVREPAALPNAPSDSTLAAPNLEPLGVVGPVVAVLSGAAASGGDIRRSLIEMKIPDSELAGYEHKIREGNVLVVARSDDDSERARAKNIFDSVGAFDTTTVGGRS